MNGTGSEEFGEDISIKLGSSALCQVFKGYLYMCKFGGASLKRHLMVTNCSGLLASLTCKGGYCSVKERQSLVKIRLAVHHQNRSGKVRNRFTGIPKLLKESQPLDSHMPMVVEFRLTQP